MRRFSLFAFALKFASRSYVETVIKLLPPDCVLAVGCIQEREHGHLSGVPAVHGLMTNLALGVTPLLERQTSRHNLIFRPAVGTLEDDHCVTVRLRLMTWKGPKRGWRQTESCVLAYQLLRKLLSAPDRLGCLSFRSALASICRIRSRVTENCWPTSSSV